jgi:hypothetical protein
LVPSPPAALLVLEIVPAIPRPRALRAAKIHGAIRAQSVPYTLLASPSARRAWYLREVSRFFAFLLLACSVWAAGSSAKAYEDQASVDTELAYVHAFAPDSKALDGVAIGAGASLGLSNVLTLRGQFMWAFHPSDEPLVSVAWLSADLVYVLDVLEWVPYFGAGVDGAAFIQSGRDTVTEFGVHPVIGFDYLISREIALGMQVKPVFLLSALDELPVYLQAGVTLSFLFDT